MNGCAVIKSKMTLINKKSYILLIANVVDQTIIIGRLGRLKFKKGFYVYLGSAKRNIIQRIKRHLSNNKKKFWHIDYLLMSKGVKIRAVWIDSNGECTMAQQFLRDGFQYIGRFSSSDCRCPSHLFIVGRNTNMLKKS